MFDIYPENIYYITTRCIYLSMAYYTEKIKNKRMFSIHEPTARLWMNYYYMHWMWVFGKKCSIPNWVNASLIIARVIFNNNIFPKDFTSIKNIFKYENTFFNK